MSTLDGTPETSMSEPQEQPLEAGPLTPRSPRGGIAGPPLDRVEPLNLARRPFLNSRPVVRVSLLLLLLGLALLAWNVAQFQKYLSESADKRAQIEQGGREVTRQRQAGAELQSQLGALNLEQKNERVELLNDMIAERTFSWSLLLDRLADVLPNDVRVLRLTPKMEENDLRRGRTTSRTTGRTSRRTRNENEERKVLLSIQGESRNDEALNQFVDNLLGHPSFEYPNPTQEARADEVSNLVTFNLSVNYIPGRASQNVVIEEMPAPGTGAAPKVPGASGAPEGDRP